MKNVLLAILLSIPLRAGAVWEAPPNPDPRTILDEAETDAEKGRYEDALAKHLWFFHHALEHRRSLSGVRLSFALSDWYELGKVYPPAMEKLKKTRNDAAKKVTGHSHDVYAFQEMSAINRYLGDESKTVEAFMLLDKDAPEVARRVYSMAQPALIKAKKFKSCGKYIQPDRSYALLVKSYESNCKLAEEQQSSKDKQDLARIAEESFTEDASTLIALLVLNDRKQEAQKIVERAKSELKNADRATVIDAALEGKIPQGAN